MSPRDLEVFIYSLLGLQVHVITSSFSCSFWGPNLGPHTWWQILYQLSYLSSPYLIFKGKKINKINSSISSNFLRMCILFIRCAKHANKTGEDICPERISSNLKRMWACGVWSSVGHHVPSVLVLILQNTKDDYEYSILLSHGYVFIWLAIACLFLNHSLAYSVLSITNM